MRGPDVLEECWEMLKRKPSPTPNKSFPKDLLRLAVSICRAFNIVYLFGVLLWGFLIYLFYFNKEDTIGKNFFLRWQFKWTPRQAFPQVPLASPLPKDPQQPPTLDSSTPILKQKRASFTFSFSEHDTWWNWGEDTIQVPKEDLHFL